MKFTKMYTCALTESYWCILPSSTNPVERLMFQGSWTLIEELLGPDLKEVIRHSGSNLQEGQIWGLWIHSIYHTGAAPSGGVSPAGS